MNVRYLILFFLLSPSFAFADAGIPMLALAWPYLWLTFIPVCLIEALVAHNILSISWKKSLEISIKANFISTLAGVPATWIFMLGIELFVGFGLSNIHTESKFLEYATFPFMVAWLSPSENPWYLYIAALILFILFCLASIYIENGVARKYVSATQYSLIKKWAIKANILSYMLNIVVVSILYFLKNS